MNSANYIGRVGALAVALGVGAAVATGHGMGIARADETGTNDNPPSADASPDPSTPAAGETKQTPPTGSNNPDPEKTKVDPAETEMEFDHSGGQDSSVNDDGQSTGNNGDEDDDEDRATTTPTPTPETTPNPGPVAPTQDNPPAAENPPGPQGQAEHGHSAGAPPAGTPLPNDPPTGNLDAGDDVGVTALTTGGGMPTQGRLSFVPMSGSEDRQRFTASGNASAFTTTQPAPAPLAPQPSGPVDVILGLPGVAVSMATTVVATLLAPFLAPGPVNPVQPPLVLFAVLDWVRREIQRTFFNRSPNAVVDTVTTSEGVSTSIPVLANDTDADAGDIVTVTGFTQPDNGTVVLNPNGTFTYTPDANYSGTDTFEYTISDAASPWHIHGLLGFFTGGGHTDSVTVNVTVTGVNDPPVAVDDTNSTAEDNAVSGNVLANDTDVDTPASGLSAALATGPANGTAIIGPNGTYTYKPNANFNGTDSFTYTVSDGALADTATVTVTITPVNDPPVAADDTAAVAEDSIANPINVLANDTDPDTGDRRTVDDVTQGANGTVLNNGNSVLYTPNPNFFGTDTFTYTISDRNGATATATVTVTVTNINDIPTADPDTYTTDEDTSVLIDALHNDTDPDGDNLDRKLVTDPSHGTLAEINDGPNAGAWTYTPNAGFSGTDTFTYRAFDGTDFSNTVTVTINVTPVNDAPVANPDEYSTLEDTALTVSIPNGVTGNDSDADDNAALIATVVDPPDHGTLDFNSNGTFTYTPAANYHGTDTFTYTVSDGELDSNTTTVTITITAVEDAPVARDDSFTATEDTALPLNVTSNDVDGDGDLLFIASVGQPGHGTLTPQIGSLIYTPDADYNGTDTFTYTVTDGTGISNTATVTITVTPVNDAPVANPDTYTTAEDTALTVSIPNGVTGNDSDADDNAALIATVVDTPDHGTLDFNPNGTFTYTPNASYHSTDTFTYHVSDGELDSNTTTVTITIDAYVSPITANDDAYTAIAGTYTELTPALTANDTTDLGSPLGAITIVTEPTYGILFKDNGVLNYRPMNGFTGTDTFTYTVADSANSNVLSNTATVTVTVISPLIANDDAYTVLMDIRTDLTPALTANDTTAPGVPHIPLGAVTIVDGPTHGMLTQTGDTWSYRPYNSYQGIDTFTYTVTDGYGVGAVSNVATVTLTVVPYNPLFAADDAYTILGRPTVLTPTANDTTDLGRPLGAVTIVSGPSHGTLSTTGGVLTYTPATGYVGTDTFTYTVADSVDPTEVSVPATVTLTVIAYNPILANDDAYSIPFETPTVLTPGITANDTTDLGSPLGAVTIVANPTHGTLSTTGGALTYTPDSDYVGTDTFTYTVADSVDPTQVSVPSTVTLTVYPYSPIVARNDVYTVFSGTFTPLRPAITANDTTAANGLGAVTIVTGPTHGYLTEQDGVLTYRAGNDYTGTDTFTYTVADSAYPDIVSNPATVTLTVVDSLPILARDDRFTVFTNEPIALTPEMIYNDSTTTGNPVGAITVLTQPAHGTLTETNGTLTYTPDPNFQGVDSFLYTVADSVDPTVVSLPAVVTLTVTDPITSQNDFYWVPAGVSTELSPGVTANDVTHTGNPLGVPVIFAQPLNGTVTVVGNTWLFTPKAGFTGLTTFGYRVTDSVNTAWSSSAIVFVTVSAD